ncbi:bifunctional folylpolyglutamate synthase/dihydrofolate synthase [Bacillus sp. T33-2]|uniref:bifunctional folylpolyglutamate synthase/dihydrofolate synthase n=1 Tax=Bacillus sp. T33-2 TaxID=2054168 RepID=UPI000C77DDF4|nr:folylpolyglutamate synthase/dihydrofolate synthase family protein [Bacillus sp. T33-2]PLR93702.1 bifunctional folylpolyglutamate synthase/dihydrofolate synthase [Bacillus sp. T33-2]
MFNTYAQALDWIHSRLRLGIKPGLARMNWMLDRLGNPERKIKTIHIGGTNGKGSTVTFLRCILEEAGYRVGTFTSPYFEQFNERISINGEPISDEDIVKLANIIKPLADELEQTELGGPTEFEIITAMSIYFFGKIDTQVDVVIFEVGLGGRFDSTNVIHPLLSVITSIGLDHTNILGHTYQEIAMEKAGIIKNGVSAISGVKQPEALAVIKNTAHEMDAPFYGAAEQFFITEQSSLPKGERFSVSSPFGVYDGLEVGLIGKHQTENASLAIMASQVLCHYFSFQISETDIRGGLAKAYWPGRFEVLSEKPHVIIDGAHNEEGIIALVNELKTRFNDKRIDILFAALKDKKLVNMVSSLDTVANSITFTQFDFPRAAMAEELFYLSSASAKEKTEDWKAFLDEKIVHLKPGELLVVTGSLYFISEVKPHLHKILKNKL